VPGEWDSVGSEDFNANRCLLIAVSGKVFSRTISADERESGHVQQPGGGVG
jgi:hypothetical protein